MSLGGLFADPAAPAPVRTPCPKSVYKINTPAPGPSREPEIAAEPTENYSRSLPANPGMSVTSKAEAEAQLEEATAFMQTVLGSTGVDDPRRADAHRFYCELLRLADPDRLRALRDRYYASWRSGSEAAYRYFTRAQWALQGVTK